MKRAYTNKKTGQIDDVSQLQTDDDDSTASTNLSRVRINEIVESTVPKKKGRLVGLGRRSRSAAPSSAPHAYVDPEVLTAQLKDKDDRISALEAQNSEGRKFLGKFRGTFVPRKIPRNICSSVFSDKHSEKYFVETSEDWTIGIPSVFSEEPSDELCVLGVSSEFCFLGIPSAFSDGIPRNYEFPRTFLVGMSSE
ncbi:hypothetical protein YC2023_066861 [Brassica napus]